MTPNVSGISMSVAPCSFLMIRRRTFPSRTSSLTVATTWSPFTVNSWTRSLVVCTIVLLRRVRRSADACHLLEQVPVGKAILLRGLDRRSHCPIREVRCEASFGSGECDEIDLGAVRQGRPIAFRRGIALQAEPLSQCLAAAMVVGEQRECPRLHRQPRLAGRCG